MSSGMKCANCGKGVAYGHEVSHAKNRTKRLFAPNLHPARVMIDGALKRVRLCTKCLRKLKKQMQINQAVPIAQIVSQATV